MPYVSYPARPSLFGSGLRWCALYQMMIEDTNKSQRHGSSSEGAHWKQKAQKTFLNSVHRGTKPFSFVATKCVSMMTKEDGGGGGARN